MSFVVPCMKCLYGPDCQPPVGVQIIFARDGCGIPTINNQLAALKEGART